MSLSHFAHSSIAITLQSRNNKEGKGPTTTTTMTMTTKRTRQNSEIRKRKESLTGHILYTYMYIRGHKDTLFSSYADMPLGSKTIDLALVNW